MFTVNAVAAFDGPSSLTTTTVERRDVGPRDVLIKISYCGICHSDIHTVCGDWGSVHYPLVPGHEITGIVAEVGDAVTRHQIGDRVGVGCMIDSCGTCVHCVGGEEQFCRNGNTLTYGSVDRDGNLTQGGYATHIVVTEDFVLRIPEALELDVAAPLLCAGVSTYSPLKRWGAGPGRKVAVIGLGGLGHVAVKIAHAMEAEVTVLSRSGMKSGDSRRFGADYHRVTTDTEVFTELADSFDLMINTASAKIDLDNHLALLAVDGVLVNLGAPAEPLSLNMLSLINGRRSCVGSVIGGIRETQEMLGFCAANGVGAEVEVIGAEEIDMAYRRMLEGEVRYRFVIDTSTLC